jgi:galactokinase
MNDIVALHRAEYEGSPEVVAAAPGVVKMLGEQTESSDGLVLSAALGFDIRVAVSPRKDSSLRFYAADLGERKRTSLGNLKFKREDRWANYTKSVLDLLFKEGLPPKGLNFTITGDIPIGVGLASSTALGLASALALKELFGLVHKPDELVELCRRAELEFFGKASPLYDSMTSALATPNSISIVDSRTGRRRALPFVDGDYVFVLTDSKVPRLSVDAELRQREDDCRRCLGFIAKGSKKSLRDLNPEEIEDLMGVLPESVRRRCLHVVEEHQRVLEAEECLAKGDAVGFGRVINKSHASLRNLYEVSCPEVDWLAKRAVEIEGVLCSRLTGKGFGGCTVSIMQRDAVAEYKKRLEDYERIFGFRAVVYEADIAGGLRLIG